MVLTFGGFGAGNGGVYCFFLPLLLEWVLISPDFWRFWYVIYIYMSFVLDERDRDWDWDWAGEEGKALWFLMGGVGIVVLGWMYTVCNSLLGG